MRKKILLSEVEEVIAGGPSENERVALCCYQGHEGIIDVDGNVIVPFKYSSINGFVWDSSGRLAVVDDNGLLGHVDLDGNEVIPCQFPFVVCGDDGHFCFNQERFPVLDSNQLIGFIDPMGNKVISGRYYQVGHFSQGLCPVKNKEGLWGYIDLKGNLAIPYQYTRAYSFNKNGQAKVWTKERKLLFWETENLVSIDCLGNIVK